jgi:hypothetical protein
MPPKTTGTRPTMLKVTLTLSPRDLAAPILVLRGQPFTRLTYAFSKKWENLKAALALHFAHHNFCRVHGSLRIRQRWQPRLWTTFGLLTN